MNALGDVGGMWGMGGELLLWLSFVLAGLCTTLPRASFIVLGARASLPGVVQRALRYAPAAALAAIVVPDVVVVGDALAPLNPKLAGILAAIAAAVLWRNPWLPFVAGMAALLGTRALLGVV